MKNDTWENRSSLALNKSKIPDAKLLMGSISDKYPIVLDDGRTTIYISDKSKEAETRIKYEALRNSKFPAHLIKYHSKTS